MHGNMHNMREWLSGGAPPCQGGGRGFDPRLALFFISRKYLSMGEPGFLLSNFQDSAALQSPGLSVRVYVPNRLFE